MHVPCYPGINRTWRGKHLNPCARKILLHSRRGVRFYSDVARPRGGLAVFPKIEASNRDWPIRHPARDLDSLDAGFLPSLNFRGLPGRDQRPILWIAELEIEIRHLHPAIRIPRSPRSHVKQTTALFGENLPTVHKLEIELLPASRRFRQHDRNHIVAASRKLRPFNRRIVNEFHRAAVESHSLHRQEARQFEHERSLTAVEHFALQLRTGVNLLGRHHVGSDHILTNRNPASPDPLALRLRCTVQFWPCRPRRQRRERGPNVVVSFSIQGLGLTSLYLFRRG